MYFQLSLQSHHVNNVYFRESHLYCFRTKSVDPLMVLDKLLRGYDRRSTPTSTQGQYQALRASFIKIFRTFYLEKMLLLKNKQKRT